MKYSMSNSISVLWHREFGMNWFLKDCCAQFHDVSLKSATKLIRGFENGVTRIKLETQLAEIRVENPQKIAKKLISNGFLVHFKRHRNAHRKIKEKSVCEIFFSKKRFFSGLVIAHRWAWYFPKKLRLEKIQDILRKELGQLCLYENDQLFRIISCMKGKQITRPGILSFKKNSSKNEFPTRINLLTKCSRRIKDRYDSLEDAYIGPGKIISFATKTKLRLPFSMYFCRYSDSNEFDPNPHLDCWSCGKDENVYLAKRKAIAEAVERFSCSQFTNVVIQGSFEKMQKPILPSTLIQISKRRLLKIKWLTQFDPKKKYAWINGYNYQNKEKVQILADLVLYPYYPKYNNIIVANSTGVATHKNAEMAINNATLELIERDAFALHWILRKSPSKIMLNSLPKSFEKYICWLKKVASLFVLFDMGNDLLPVLGALAIARGKGMWVSAAADSNPTSAMRKVLQELIASIATSRHTGLLDSPDSSKKIGRVSDHEMLYRSPRAQKQAFFLTTGKKTTWKKIEENCHPVDNHADYITKSGITLYIVKLNCYNFARMIREPLYTVKALSPDLVPFYFGEELIPDASHRLLAMQKKWGVEKLNIFPHPFN